MNEMSQRAQCLISLETVFSWFRQYLPANLNSPTLNWTDSRPAGPKTYEVDMTDTVTIKFPPSLRKQAEEKAKDELLSFSAYVRRLVAADLRSQPAAWWAPPVGAARAVSSAGL
jgi:hypothetical protein